MKQCQVCSRSHPATPHGRKSKDGKKGESERDKATAATTIRYELTFILASLGPKIVSMYIAHVQIYVSLRKRFVITKSFFQ